MAPRWTTLVLIFLAGLPHAALGEVTSDFRGDVRSRLFVFTPFDVNNYTLELRLRPELVTYLTDDLSAVVTVNALRLLGDTSKLSLLGAPVGTGSEGSFQVDRAYFDYELGRWDLRIGRRDINLGPAQIWNPVDLVDSNTALNRSVEKRGVDAVRGSLALSSTARAIGLLSFVDGVPLSLVRGELLLGGTGVGVMAADDRRRDEQVFGLDLKGDLLLGLWIEAAYHLTDERSDYFRGVVGADYSFNVAERLTLSAQYYYDSSGGTGIDDYNYAAFASGKRSFLARQYASLVSVLSFNELTSLSVSAILNLQDLSSLTSVGVSRYFFENLEVSGRAFLATGPEQGEYNPNEEPITTFELYLDWRF